MPATPGVSVDVTVNPAMGFVASTTWNPFAPVEAGRTVVEPDEVEPESVSVSTRGK